MHRETSCTGISNKQNCAFFKNGDQKVKQVLSGSWYQWDGEDIRKGCRRVTMVEYSVLMYENGKIKSGESSPRIREGRIKENSGEANAAKLCCKQFVNVTMLPQYIIR
jgi:hypothetical protein